MKERHKVTPASYLILRKGDEILLMLRQNTSYYDGWYTVPSGHVEEGESPIDAVIRETKEEIGLDLDRASIKHALTMYRVGTETGDRADYFFKVTNWQGEPINAEPMKCVEIGWFSIRSLPENLMHHVKDALECIEKHISYSELGLDRVVKNPS